MNEQVELIFIPLTAKGHITPMIEFAKLLVARDRRLSATVLLIKLPRDANLAAYADALAASSAPSQRINFVDITDDALASPGHTPTRPLQFTDSYLENHKSGVRNAVERIIRRRGSPDIRRRIAGFVVDTVCIAMKDVAAEFGAPTYVFWVSSSAWLAVLYHVEAVNDDESLDLNGEITVPGFGNTVPASILPPAVFDKAGVLLRYARRMRETRGVIANTFTELEQRVLGPMISGDGITRQLPPLYTVGPVLNLTARDEISQKAFSGSEQCATSVIEWLDEQPPSSVIFLCFGSIGTFGKDQIREIASALERTGFRFLWTLRFSSPTKDSKITFSSDQVDPERVLPEGFMDRTAEVGRVISWAPQTAALSHRAIGAFVSHCGWNSLLESLWFGVPIAAWPAVAMSDQGLNAFLMARELGLATEIRALEKGRRIGDRDEAAVVGAEEIEEGMRRVMAGERGEVRKRVREMSEKSRKAVTEGGSSYFEVERFVNDLFDHLS